MRLLNVVVAGLLLAGAAGAQEEAPALTPEMLEAALTSGPQGVEAERLAERIRSAFGGRTSLVKGVTAPRIDELRVAWALEVPSLPADAPAPRVVSDVVHFNLPLTRVGATDVHAGVVTLSHGTAFTWHFEAGGARLGGGQLEVYETHPDSRERQNVPRGALRQMPAWESMIFGGTSRDWWVYVPAQYTPDTPAAVMVFQDGASYRECPSTPNSQLPTPNSQRGTPRTSGVKVAAASPFRGPSPTRNEPRALGVGRWRWGVVSVRTA